VDDAIVALERVAAQHWRGTEEEWLGGWLLRAAEGFTGRANSALPLADPGRPLDSMLDAVTHWYRSRGLRPMIAIPLPLDANANTDAHPAGGRLDHQLSERAWLTRPGPAFVMVADLANVPAPREIAPDLVFAAAEDPDDAWLGMYHYRGQERQPPVMREVLMSAPLQLFASIRSADGQDVLAIGRLSVAAGWAGVTAVEVDAGRRRGGLGTALTLAVCGEAAARGLKRVFLQVETDNMAAIQLYERCGFRCSHRYHYRVAPN
jgi:ribosomal protein S18 acetylase RimI-like enzyme